MKCRAFCARTLMQFLLRSLEPIERVAVVEAGFKPASPEWLQFGHKGARTLFCGKVLSPLWRGVERLAEITPRMGQELPISRQRCSRLAEFRNS
jgi:hypothetical protein